MAQPIAFCQTCGLRQGAVSGTHLSCGGDEAYCRCLQDEESTQHQIQQPIDEKPESPKAHDEYKSSADEYDFDNDWEAAALSCLHHTLDASPVTDKDDKLGQHRKRMAIISQEFKDIGCADVYSLVANSNLAGNRATQLVTGTLHVHAHASATKWIKKKVLPDLCSIQKKTFQAGQWATGCYESYPPETFAADMPDKVATWKEASTELKKEHLEAREEERLQPDKAKAILKAKQSWVLKWANKLLLAKQLKEEEQRLMMTPEKISSYFNNSSPAVRGLKRKAIAW